MPLDQKDIEEIESLKSEARELLEFFPSHTGLVKRDIITEILEHEARIDLEIKIWKDKFGKSIIGHGVSKTAIRQIGNALETIFNRQISVYTEGNVIKENNKTRTWIAKAKECKVSIEGFLAEKKNPLKEEKESNKLSGLQWNVYYLHFRANDLSKEPLLCRARILIDENDKVTFENIFPDGSKNYHGDFTPDIDMGTGIITFNLEGEVKGSTSHIKVFCDQKTQPILLGQYNCFVKNRIMSGDVLFEFAKTKEDLKNVGSFSFIERTESFQNKDDINPIIRDYFALSIQNYHQVFTNVDSLETLKAKMDNYDSFKNKQSLFLEKPTPEVMLAAPSFMSGGGSNEDLYNAVIKTFEEYLPKIKVTPEKIFDKDDHPLFLDNLELLRTKRFFILIMPEINKLSFSHIQFAMAISLSKNVFIICRTQDVSKTIKELERLQLIKIFPIEYDFFEEWPKISKKVVEEIKYNLPNNLDGVMDIKYAGIH